MFSQFCGVCRNEIRSEGQLPLEFCTNCGTKLPPPPVLNNAPKYSMAAQYQGAKKKNDRTLFWLLLAVPAVLIVTGLLGVGMLFFGAMQGRRDVADFPPPLPPTNGSTPKNSSNSLLSFGKEGLGQGEFKNAAAIAVDRDGNIYVGDGTLRIQKFDAAGKFLQLWNVTESKFKTDENYTNGITHLAVDGKNRLYVGVNNDELLRYDGATGKFIDKIPLYGEKWMNTAQEATIMDMVMLNDDRLAVFATSFPRNEYVIMVSPDGKPEIKHKQLLSKQTDGATLMRGAMLVNVAGDIFLMNGLGTGKPYLYRFKADGSYVDRFTWDGSPMTVFSNKIVALNSKGEIYAHNAAKSQINVLSSEGVQLRSIPLKTSNFQKMILDSADNIFILSRGKVEKFSSAGS